MRAILGLAVWLAAIPVGAIAADLPPEVVYRQCVSSADYVLVPLSTVPELRLQIDQKYAHSVEVAARTDVIYSSRPTFIWASEAKVACGKAIGYLKSNTVDAQYIGKCTCFYDRMLSFLY